MDNVIYPLEVDLSIAVDKEKKSPSL